MTSEAETLAALLKSKRTEDRVRAVTHLAKGDHPEKVRWLLGALQDKANYVAALAAEALRECADWAACGVMRDWFLHLSEDGKRRDPGCHVRAHLAFAFGRMEYFPAVDALRIGIRTVQIEPVGGVPFDTGTHLRANCALALAQMRAPDALRDITLLLFDTSGNALAGEHNSAAVKMEARKTAAQAMARLGDRNALVPLTLRLTYPQNEMPEVLQECMQAVVALEDERAVELLAPYLRHTDPFLAAYAALMIAQTRTPEAPALLKEVIPTFRGNALQATILALFTLRTEEAQRALHSLVTEDGPLEVQLAIVEALAGSQDEADRALLQHLAKHAMDATLRNAAKRALT